MTADEMAEAKHKVDMDDKMKAMIREILFYALLLFLLLIVINGQQDTNSYRQNANIIRTFGAKLNNDVSNHTFVEFFCEFVCDDNPINFFKMCNLKLCSFQIR